MPVIVGSVIIWQVDWSQRGVAIFGYTLIPVFGAPYVSLGAIQPACITAYI